MNDIDDISHANQLQAAKNVAFLETIYAAWERIQFSDNEEQLARRMAMLSLQVMARRIAGEFGMTASVGYDADAD